MTRAAWGSVLITVVLLVTLSWTGTWLLEPGAPPPPATAATDPPSRTSTFEHRVATVWTAVGRESREIVIRVAAADPAERRMALAVLLGVASLGILTHSVAVFTRRRRDRRPTPTTNLGRWTRRTGLARDAARFLMSRHERQHLPPAGSGATIPDPPRHG